MAQGNPATAGAALGIAAPAPHIFLPLPAPHRGKRGEGSGEGSPYPSAPATPSATDPAHAKDEPPAAAKGYSKNEMLPPEPAAPERCCYCASSSLGYKANDRSDISPVAATG